MSNLNIRIPNLQQGKIVDENGMPTDDEQTFRQILISNLQNIAGSEGLVCPSQENQASPNDFIKQIQNNQLENGEYTCGFGRFIYDSTNNRMLVSIDGGSGVPKFMQLTLTTPSPPL